MRYAVLWLSIFLLSLATPVLAEMRCIDAEGEAAVTNNDLPSGKAEAIARAKWAAVEEVVGVQVKAQSVVQNMTLVDDAVSSRVDGFVTKYKVLAVKPESDVVAVKINACVDSVKAQQAVSSLALNNSVAVFIPLRKPKVAGEQEEVSRSRHGKSERHSVAIHDELEEANILSETISGMLAEHGVTVVDAAPNGAADAALIESSMRSGNFMSLRSLMYQSLSNLLLLGSIDYTVSNAKGQDMGYGLTMPFNRVTVRLTYRLVSKDAGGKVVVLAVGTKQGKGVASSVEDATAEGLQELAEAFAPVVRDKVTGYLKGVVRKVTVKVEGVTDVSTSFDVKDMLESLTWVSDVEQKELDQFLVSYQENPIYLANGMSQRGFPVTLFAPHAITARYPQRQHQ